MTSLLLIFVCALMINSQARTLTDKRDHQLGEISQRPPSRATASPTGAADYNRPGIPPPPAPKPGRPTLIEMITTRSMEENMFWIMKNYGREEEHELAPPSPKEAPPTHQVTGAASSEFFGKEGGELPPSTPHPAPSTHEVTGGGAAASGNYGKKGGAVPPPAPHHAPPTHQVSGGRAAALGNYGKEGGEVAPPAPHHAPPTHQVSGSGAAEMEESRAYVLLSASA